MHRPLALAKYIAGYPARFDWLDANCCHFAAGWVREVEGFDPMAGLPPTPTEHAALRLVVTLGGSMLAVWRDHFLKREPILPTLAQVGDVVLLPVPGGWLASGICGGRTAVFVNANGDTEHRPMTDAAHAWRIGA